MKILFITPYITTNKHKAFLRNRTGFGLMVYDIANNIGMREHVDLYAVNAIAPHQIMDNFNTIRNSWLSFLCGIRFSNFLDSLKFLRRYKLPFKDQLRVIYQHLSVGGLSSKLRGYDIVHIHGCGPITNAAIKLCKRKKIPFCATLHGLVSFEEQVLLHPSLKQYERDFLVEAYTNDYAVSFISTGNYEQALAFVKFQH